MRRSRRGGKGLCTGYFRIVGFNLKPRLGPPYAVLNRACSGPKSTTMVWEAAGLGMEGAPFFLN